MTVTEKKSSDRAFRLDGKRALVTGGASGIGQATCRELASAGAYIYIADLNFTGAKALADELGGAHALQMDVTQPGSIAAAFEQISHLDILINNAGIGHVGDIMRTELEDLSLLVRQAVDRLQHAASIRRQDGAATGRRRNHFLVELYEAWLFI